MRVAAHPALAQMLFIILNTLPRFALSTVPTLVLAAVYLLWQSTISLALVLFAILRPYTPAITLLALARVMSPALPAVDIILALGALRVLSAGGKLGVQRGDSGTASPCRKARRRPPPKAEFKRNSQVTPSVTSWHGLRIAQSGKTLRISL